MNKDQCIANLLELIEQAIKSGDWNVDGACDTSLDIAQARNILHQSGYVKNSIDDSYIIAV